jgi:hypothetical protein
MSRMTRFSSGARLACLAAACTAYAGPALTQDDEAGTSLTIYSSARPGAIPPESYRPVPGQGNYFGQSVPGYAMVRQSAQFDLTRGRNRVNLTNVAAYIDPTTVRFESLTDPSTRVIEQGYQFDLVSSQKLMERYIDQVITIDQQSANGLTQITGRLLTADGTLVLAGDDGRIHSINEYSNIHFPELPGGLITRPTLAWDLMADRAGMHRTKVSYQTTGITWWADYNLTFEAGADENSGFLDVGAWVSILNQSGASYDDARLKLIAGDVNRIEPPGMPTRMRVEAFDTAAADAAGFEERSFFEFHLYTLGRQTSIPNNSTRQIELFPALARVPARKLLAYYGAMPYYTFGDRPMTDRDLGIPMNTKVDVYLEFDNNEESGLGIPLPAGRVRVSQLDESDDSLELIGENVIEHTPRDETVLLRLGSAFDVVGERRQVDFEIDTGAERMEETIEVTLRNHKTEPVEVIVKESLFRWATNDVVEATHDYEREDNLTIHFPVTVPADGEVVVRYRVRYTW